VHRKISPRRTDLRCLYISPASASQLQPPPYPALPRSRTRHLPSISLSPFSSEHKLKCPQIGHHGSHGSRVPRSLSMARRRPIRFVGKPLEPFATFSTRSSPLSHSVLSRRRETSATEPPLSLLVTGKARQGHNRALRCSCLPREHVTHTRACLNGSRGQERHHNTTELALASRRSHLRHLQPTPATPGIAAKPQEPYLPSSD
jgi:hypothetical protein